MMDYINLAMRTAKDLGAPNLDFAHAALGMVDEAYELYLATSEENALEELGDLCWFIALAGRALDVHPFHLEAGLHSASKDNGTLGAMVEFLGEHAAYIAGPAKKWLVAGKHPGEGIANRLARMVYLVRSIAEMYGWTLEHVQEANIRKLATRYPEGFTDWHANNRDVDEEMKALRRES